MRSCSDWGPTGTQSIRCCTMHDVNSKTDCRHAGLKLRSCLPCSASQGKLSAHGITNDIGVLMNRSRFENWLRNIYETHNEEISCTECFDLISRFVELEIAGHDVIAEMPQLRQHFDQCRACRDEYEALRDLRRL